MSSHEAKELPPITEAERAELRRRHVLALHVLTTVTGKAACDLVWIDADPPRVQAGCVPCRLLSEFVDG